MKIIATIGRNFLVEATDDELAKVQGVTYASSLPRHGYHQETFPLGSTVEVNEAWNDLARFRDAQHRIESAAETLRAVAQLAVACSSAYVVAPAAEMEVKP